MLHIVRVKGDSMEPKLIDGDLILVDRAQAMPSDGRTYVVRIWEAVGQARPEDGQGLHLFD